MILKFLIIYGIFTQIFDKAALTCAIINDNIKIVELLLRKEDIDINIRSILYHKHSWYSSLTFFMVLKFWMILWNLFLIFNFTALICAIMNNRIEIVRLLLQQEGIGINMQDILNQNHSWYSNLSFFFMVLKFTMIYGI